MLVRLEMYLDNEVGDQRLSERFDLEVSAAKSFSNIFMIVNDRMLLNHLTTSGRSLHLEVIQPTGELFVILSGLGSSTR